ncbi:MAG: hypothetical protein O9267_13865 [Flavobacterium sp.]|uniref:hypothetical protein n=1 Tax=Flavobacterium sp. TaxID=239 RepID=UPI0022BFE6AC|nr:hypothetical protein [Flavobacterium sp.]MCZ8198686.1 hypothetical protein [Flavobacterium sp.]
MKDNLTIKALKFISERNGEYKPVNIKQFLLNNFPEKPEMAERIEMKRFVEYLEKSEYIEFISEEGLWFVQLEGRKIPRNEISAYAKIKSKGFDIIRESDKNKKNSFSFYLSIFLGITSLIFGILNYSNQLYLKEAEKDLKETEKELNSARDSLTMYQGNYNKLKVQYKILEESHQEK